MDKAQSDLMAALAKFDAKPTDDPNYCMSAYVQPLSAVLIEMTARASSIETELDKQFAAAREGREALERKVSDLANEIDALNKRLARDAVKTTHEISATPAGLTADDVVKIANALQGRVS